MPERSIQEIEDNIKQVIESYVMPAVEQHGGHVNFVKYTSGTVLLEMSGACSGCAGSTATLQFGIQQILTQMVPEVTSIEGFDDPNSTVDPYFTDLDDHHWGPDDISN